MTLRGSTECSLSNECIDIVKGFFENTDGFVPMLVIQYAKIRSNFMMLCCLVL
ncbi:hypothetical protein AAZX31_10G097100 [Glycine max]